MARSYHRIGSGSITPKLPRILCAGGVAPGALTGSRGLAIGKAWAQAWLQRAVVRSCSHLSLRRSALITPDPAFALAAGCGGPGAAALAAPANCALACAAVIAGLVGRHRSEGDFGLNVHCRRPARRQWCLTGSRPAPGKRPQAQSIRLFKLITKLGGLPVEPAILPRGRKQTNRTAGS